MTGENGSSPVLRERSFRGYAPYTPYAKTRAILEHVYAIFDEYEDHLPLTLRQVFYRLVAAYDYDKTQKAYKRLSTYLTRARRAEMFPFHYLRDDGVSVLQARWFEEPADFWDHVGRQARNYRRDKQVGQLRHVELWCEAAGMMAQLQRVADPFSIPVYSNGGYSSLSAVRTIVDRACRRDVPTVLLHVGDYDPSGEDVFTALTEDAAAFVKRDRTIGTQRIIPVRVALTAAQVALYDLPTAPPKEGDPRSKNWQGQTCQAEALPPNILAAIVREAIASQMDLALVDRHVTSEQDERRALLRELPRGDA